MTDTPDGMTANSGITVTPEEEARRAGVSVRTIYRRRAQRRHGTDGALTAGDTSPDTSLTVIVDTLTRQLEAKDRQIGDLHERLHEAMVTLNRLALPPPSTSEPTEPDQAHTHTDRRGGLMSWLVVGLLAVIVALVWYWALYIATPRLTIPTKVQIRHIAAGADCHVAETIPLLRSTQGKDALTTANIRSQPPVS